jgi:hypothetical protein
MRIAFIHYHLKPGGVTTVLKQQLRAIQEDCESLVITGEPPEESFPADCIHIPGLAYDGTYIIKESPEHIAESILKAIQTKWEEGCDILHVHNPLLKKNRHFLKILKSLQQNRLNLFLQQHDFAEDGRPTAYYREPYIANCHYGVINSRDYRILLKAGLKRQGLHMLTNAVSDIPLKETREPAENFVLYPVRAIRRKNIGEAILLSLFFMNAARLCITLPPNSPADIKAYEEWKRFSAGHDLPISFDVGLKHDFSELISASHFLISTSIGEGFGFSFLEPWTAKKLLWGRDLPDITKDFKKLGMGLEHLYPQLRIPISKGQKENFSVQWKSCVVENCRRFDSAVEPAVIDAAFDKMTANNCVEFGLLDESFQKEIIVKTLSNKKYKAVILKTNPFLSCPGRVPDAEALVEKNRKVIKSHFNQSTYKENLMHVYKTACSQPVAHRIDKTVLLKSFFNLNRFSLLTWGE